MAKDRTLRQLCQLWAKEGVYVTSSHYWQYSNSEPQMKSAPRSFGMLLVYVFLAISVVAQEPTTDDLDLTNQGSENDVTRNSVEQEVDSKKPTNGNHASLGIGSVAPPLEIDHWVSNRNGHFDKVTNFEADKVYVVEFWATWCIRCISAMPHIAELQEKYLDRGVQIISISDERLETVERFLERSVRGQDNQTYSELTGSYCLTTDPDGSSVRDYMVAAKLDGIPAAFIVGKTGLIEWIGHPLTIDKALEDVVSGNWDRTAARAEFETKREWQAMMTNISRLVGSGKNKQAIEVLDNRLKETKSRSLAKQINTVKLNILRRDKAFAAEAVDLALDMLGERDYSDEEVVGLARSIYSMKKLGVLDDSRVTAAALALAESKVDESDKWKPMILDTAARLRYATGDIEHAIDMQRKAFELASPGERPIIEKFLNELLENAESR